MRNGFSSVDCSRMRLELVSPRGESRGKLKKNPTGHTLSIIESACARSFALAEREVVVVYMGIAHLVIRHLAINYTINNHFMNQRFTNCIYT